MHNFTQNSFSASFCSNVAHITWRFHWKNKIASNYCTVAKMALTLNERHLVNNDSLSKQAGLLLHSDFQNQTI